jgi:hypothetical protein
VIAFCAMLLGGAVLVGKETLLDFGIRKLTAFKL